jgi:hypothetical protein
MAHNTEYDLDETTAAEADDKVANFGNLQASLNNYSNMISKSKSQGKNVTKD